jgi:RNA polymerase sigma-70 factor (ECF subfamily)
MSRPADPHPDDCRELFARLSAYLDGEISAGEREQIERHLGGCPPCLEFVESLRKTIGLCHDFEPSGAPPPVPDELKRKLLRILQRGREV